MKACFGKIYPDLSRIEFNKEIAGKVFHLRIGSQGMMHQFPQLKPDLTEWEDCQHCESYRSCFDLSNAKLAIQQVVSRI
jgi:hypothetical protein